MPFYKVTLKAKKPISVSYPKILNTLGDHIRKRRLDLKLLQKEVAQKIGVDKVSIYNWENNRSSPKLHYIPKVIRFLGYVPFEPLPRTPGEGIVRYRRLSGITQKELANRLGIDPSTLGRWEQDGGKPSRKLSARLDRFWVCISTDPEDKSSSF